MIYFIVKMYDLFIILDVPTSQSWSAHATNESPRSDANVSGSEQSVSAVAAQKKLVLQSSSQLQSVHSQSTTCKHRSDSASSCSTTKSSKSSGGGVRPQIKFGPNVEHLLEERSVALATSNSTSISATTITASGAIRKHDHKRKERQRKPKR